MASPSKILHRFISSVPDDPTIPEAVRPQSNWNDGHVISGGNDGDVFVVDSMSADGFSFEAVATAITGRLEQIVQGPIGSFVGNGGTGQLGMTTLVLTKTANVFVIADGRIGDSSGTLTNCVFFTFTNGVISNQYFILNNLAPVTVVQYYVLAPGTYVFAGGFNANVNPITSCFTRMLILAFS